MDSIQWCLACLILHLVCGATESLMANAAPNCKSPATSSSSQALRGKAAVSCSQDGDVPLSYSKRNMIGSNNVDLNMSRASAGKRKLLGYNDDCSEGQCKSECQNGHWVQQEWDCDCWVWVWCSKKKNCCKNRALKVLGLSGSFNPGSKVKIEWQTLVGAINRVNIDLRNGKWSDFVRIATNIANNDEYTHSLSKVLSDITGGRESQSTSFSYQISDAEKTEFSFSSPYTFTIKYTDFNWPLSKSGLIYLSQVDMTLSIKDQSMYDGADIIVQSPSDKFNRWMISKVGVYYKFVNIATSRCLDNGGVRGEGRLYQTLCADNTDNQLWEPYSPDSGVTWSLYCKSAGGIAGGFCMNNYNSYITPGSLIRQMKCDETRASFFTFREAALPPPTIPPSSPPPRVIRSPPVLKSPPPSSPPPTPDDDFEEQIDCEGEWSEFSDCSAPCGGGTQTSTFSIVQESENGGADCENADGDTDSRDCNIQPCEVAFNWPLKASIRIQTYSKDGTPLYLSLDSKAIKIGSGLITSKRSTADKYTTWRITEEKTGFYSFQNVATKLCLNAANTKSGTLILLAACKRSVASQMWSPTSLDGGLSWFFTRPLKGLKNNICMGLSGSKVSTLWQRTCDASSLLAQFKYSSATVLSSGPPPGIDQSATFDFLQMNATVSGIEINDFNISKQLIFSFCIARSVGLPLASTFVQNVTPLNVTTPSPGPSNETSDNEVLMRLSPSGSPTVMLSLLLAVPANISSPSVTSTLLEMVYNGSLVANLHEVGLLVTLPSDGLSIKLTALDDLIRDYYDPAPTPVINSIKDVELPAGTSAMSIPLDVQFPATSTKGEVKAFASNESVVTDAMVQAVDGNSTRYTISLNPMSRGGGSSYIIIVAESPYGPSTYDAFKIIVTPVPEDDRSKKSKKVSHTGAIVGGVLGGLGGGVILVGAIWGTFYFCRRRSRV